MGSTVKCRTFGIPGKTEVADIRDVLCFILDQLCTRHFEDSSQEYAAFRLHDSLHSLGYSPSEAAILADYLSSLCYVVRMPQKEAGQYVYFVDRGISQMMHCTPEDPYLVLLQNVVDTRALKARSRILDKKRTRTPRRHKP